MMSPPPPGEDGLTSRTGRFGYPAAESALCACTRAGNPPTNTIAASMHITVFIAALLANSSQHDNTLASAPQEHA